MGDKTAAGSQVDFPALAERAGRPMSALPRPFLKWAGSKRALLHQLIGVIPPTFGCYYEPFLGSGAMFFLLQPKVAVISDSCGALIDTMKAVRDDVRSIIKYLEPMAPDRDTFYDVRARRTAGRLKRSAEFIYLNKTCWNGIYRVNSRGQFNVPYGRPHPNTVVLDSNNLRACAAALRPTTVRIEELDFEDALEGAGRGDFVFLDPPYVTKHNNNGFVDYNEVLFSWADQQRLAKVATGLVQKGAQVVVTNARHAELLDLYPGFRMTALTRPSTLAADSAKRGIVQEAIIYATQAL